MATLAQLTTPLTVDEIRTSIYEVLAQTGVTTTSWKPGAVVRTIIAALAIVLAALSTLIAYIASSGFLELATGNWLTLKAHYDYGVDRIDATFAPGEVTVNNSSGGVYAFAPYTLTLLASRTGKLYRNTATVNIGALQTGVIVPIAAVEAGAASTAFAGEIDSFQTPITGLTCSNAAAVIGSDAEEDPALRIRCADRLGAISPNGPQDAYAYVARNAKRSDGTAIGVSRVRVEKDAFGNVSVYVATATGPVSGTAGDVTTDLGAVADAIQRLATPLCVTATVASATPVHFAVTYEIWLYNTSSLTEQQIKDAIEAELAAYFSAQPIGGNTIDTSLGTIYLDQLKAIIGRTHSNSTHLDVIRVLVTAPSGDTLLSVNEVPVLDDAIATAIHQVPVRGSI